MDAAPHANADSARELVQVTLPSNLWLELQSAAACLGSRRSTCVAVFRFGSSLAWVAFRYTQEGGAHTIFFFFYVTYYIFSELVSVVK